MKTTTSNGAAPAQPDLFGEPPPAPRADRDPKGHLHNQLVKLGDMLGDGLGDEPDGAWIKREYRQVAKALGYGPPRRNNSASINAAMAKYLESNRCGCGGSLSQTRTGSMRVVCGSCSKTTQLKWTKPKKA